MATEFSSDRLIVKPNPGASSIEITNLQAQIGVTKVTTAEQFGIQIWDIAPRNNLDKIISDYENDPRFEYVERDSIITLPDVKTTSPTPENLAAITPQITTPNDPYYPQRLWGLNNTGQTGGTPDADIDAPEAWDIQRGDPNLVIGVIDTGVDYNHPDLVDNIWTNPGETAGDGIDNDGNGYIDDVRGWDFAYGDNDPMDGHSHGTHVAGTIAGKGNNGVGVTGVAWQGKILPLKLFSDSGDSRTSDAILALNYATAKGVKLTNNSWGGGPYSQGLYDAINSAGQQGALFIAAAGNNGSNNDITPHYPASYDLPNIISVAATDHNDALSIFTPPRASNYGLTSVDLGAPGSHIYSTTPGGIYDYKSGTSMASPHVAGAAALVWAQNPTWSAQEVKNRLLQTTDPNPALSGLTVSGGGLNLYNALGGSTQQPANDNFANRILLGDLPVSTTGSNIGATVEPQEPSQSGAINSVWWTWTAPTTETVNFNTIGSNFDTYLSIFSGPDLPNLTLLGANDDGGGNWTSLVSLDTIAGQTYQIAVDGYASNTGQIALNVVVPPPPNDNFANRIALTGDAANSTGTNRGATGEVGEPAQSGEINSAWWSWTATSSGFFQIDTIGSNSNGNSDTYLSVFEGSDLPNLTLVGANDDGGGNYDSLVNVNATPGTTYQLAVDGFLNRTGPINLNIAPTAPPNDNFANRIALTGDTANATGSNIRATGEVGEPPQSGDTNSVWWTWTAPNTGSYTINTEGSGYDTWLSLFSGDDVSNLSLLAYDDDSGEGVTSRINLDAQAGQTYQIAVDGYWNSIGQINLNIAPTPPGFGNLSETANNTLKGEKDSLTGADTASPFPPSSARAPVADIANIEKTDDLLIEGGAMMNAPSLFSPAVNNAPTLVKELSPAFTDANGALAGNPPLGINPAPFGVANTSPFLDPYRVGVYEPKSSGISVA
jgi:subtilisin family serine protease